MTNKLVLVLALIISVSAGSAAFSETKGDPAKGKQVYDTRCAMCHGPGGKGDGPASASLEPKPRDLSDAEYMSGITNEYMYKIIAEGGAAVDMSPAMPAHKGMLSEADIQNVIAHVRENLCECEPK